MRDHRIVWDTSQGGQVQRCKACKRSPCACRRPEERFEPGDITAKVRLDTSKKRSGKAVTVVGNLPHAPTYFKALSKRLKAHCGTGGSFKDDQIEVQGDQREKVRAFLEGEGFQVDVR